MKSPFTGGSVTKKFKIETLTFRKEKFTVKRYYYICNDTGKTFSNAEVDDLVLNDVYNQYRERYGIPSPQMLKELRLKYDLSAHIMSKIMGIGINQYGLYENGEMPTKAIGQKLATLFDRKILLRSIDKARFTLKDDYIKVREKVENHTVQLSLPLKKEYYKDFVETSQIKPFDKEIQITPKARWSTYNLSTTLA